MLRIRGTKMTHDYIRQAIPEEISERGGALLRLVGGKTVTNAVTFNAKVPA